MGSSDEKYPDFFKVFIPHHCSKNLKIPDAFLDNLSEKIPEKVILRSRLGGLWPVEVAETKDGLFIQEGWSRLVLDNALQPGDFLVFKYNGYHVFDIIIFGASGCEKEQDCSVAREEKGMMPEAKGQQEKYKRQSRVLEGEVNGEMIENELINSGKKQLREQIGEWAKLGGREQNNSFSGYHPRNLERQINPRKLALSNPFFVTKRNRYRTELTIPHDIRENLTLKLKKKIILQDPKGILWKAVVVQWKNGRVVVKDGWKKLCQWNQISEDDILVCELLPSNSETCQVIKVHIH